MYPLRKLAGAGLLALLLAGPLAAQGLRVIPGHVPSAVAMLRPLDNLPGTNRLHLVMSLPLRKQGELNNLLAALTDPASTNFHQWLAPDDFTRRFGPTEEDYQKVVGFARTNGLWVTGLCSNRMLVDVEAPVANIQTAFHVTLHHYAHPLEARNFYAPDSEPTVDPNIPLLHVRGLDNFTLPHRLGGALTPLPRATGQTTADYTGSGPGGYFMGNDFRAAYVPGVTNTGAGQYIAVIDVGGPYYPLDVYMYETNAGLSTNIVVTNVLLPGATGIPTGTNQDDGEEALDICMSLSMAPAATILNYEGDGADIFNRIASDNLARQMTLSYGFGIDAGVIQSFQEFLAQGQAMSQASGDGDSDLNGGTGLTGNPYATIVGGTTLTTSGAGGPWSSETTWNWGGNTGSGGGISGYGIPNWQQGINMTSNLGSTNYRNYPDVSMPADGVFLISRNGTAIGSVGGTSCASPLWAGFMALVNQQAASLGNAAVGFANPPIYAIGKGPRTAYTNCFHDIVTGNNENSQNPNRFAAFAGYDLCTGWGTPTGSNTLNILAGSGTNDFTFYTSPDRVSLVRGGAATSALTVTLMNGYAGSVTFALAGVPSGVTASLSPTTTTGSSLLTLSTTSATPLGTNLIAITGSSGTLVHSVTLTLAVTAPVPGAVPVNLSSFYNRPGNWTDGRSFSGGLDGGGYAYSANLLGTTPSWNGLAFTLGPTNANDAVSCAGQTISLPAGNFTTLQILGTAVDGSQTAQPFIVTYTDNTTSTNMQSFSDWAYPQNFAGESVAVGMAYRNNGGGSEDVYTAVDLYGYSLTLNETKTVKSLRLPNNPDVVLLAVALADEPVSAPLAAWYNLPGMYTDNYTFTNPATGGIDGSGYAYSATLLGGAQTWTNVSFAFGPANVTNVVSATNQTITLPTGYFSFLRMLATGVQGDQTNQSFLVKYTDGTTATFSQNMSDWFTPQNYPGEAEALIEGHRNSSDGTADNRTFYGYGYSFKLNNNKVVQNIKLPNDAHVVVLAISLVPAGVPVITTLPVAGPLVYGQILASSPLSGGVASVPGNFAFATPALAPNAGTALQSVIFTPTDTVDYRTITTNVSVTVNMATPAIITPPTAGALVYGQTLAGSTLSGGAASVPGTFAFTLPATLPTAGTASQSVTFTPTDTNDYTAATTNASVTVLQAAPTVAWTNSAAIVYGVVLGTNQLDAVADVPATLTYAPPAGTVPTTGTNVLAVICLPADAVDYGSVTSTVSLLVAPAPLTVVANDAVRGHGMTNPVFGGTITGLQNGDLITAAYASPATTNSPVGTYPIISTLVDPNGRLTNYLVTTDYGTLTVTNVGLTFNVNPFTEPAIVAGQNYSGTIATNASDSNGGVLTFSLASGPAWLSLSPAGALSGEPLSANVGTNVFGVSVTDTYGLSNSATFTVGVFPAPPIVISLTGTPTNLWLSWNGGIAPYQTQMSTDLTSTNWTNLGGVINSNTINLGPGNPAAFYRILGQ